MSRLNLLNASQLSAYKTGNPDEQKLGSRIKLLSNSTAIYEQLKDLDVEYVIFGIKEDIGVFANSGKRGGKDAWPLVMNEFLNMRVNYFIDPNKFALLGHLEFSEEQAQIDKLNSTKKGDLKKARKLVTELDKVVAQLVHDIVKAGKRPIVVGGGHNNAYGLLKGCSLALKTSMNAINFDAHTDFGATDGRHNGNAFSYAFNEGFLDRYFIYGLHENYITDHVVKTISKLSKRVRFNTLENLHVRKKSTIRRELARAQTFVGKKAFGIEVDCDVIEHFPAVAMTSSGLRPNHIREMVFNLARNENVQYLHICGFAPELSSKRHKRAWSKYVATLISDFIRDK